MKHKVPWMKNFLENPIVKNKEKIFAFTGHDSDGKMDFLHGHCACLKMHPHDSDIISRDKQHGTRNVYYYEYEALLV